MNPVERLTGKSRAHATAGPGHRLALVLAGVLVAATALCAPVPGHAADDAAAVATPVTGVPAAAPAAGVAAAGNPAAPASPLAGDLDSRVQDLKADVIAVNRDLLVLEEELLYPASTQVAVFVSLDVGELFGLESVQVKLDDKVVANTLYTPAEVKALRRGGVQRIFLGNLRAGHHEVVAFLTGQGPHERDYRRGATVQFDKTTEPQFIELRITDSAARLQPVFDVHLWR